jgi:hypothetical protein
MYLSVNIISSNSSEYSRKLWFKEDWNSMSKDAIYLNAALVKKAFLALKETDPGTKRGQERTSALMYFFTLARLLKTLSCDSVCLNPNVQFSRENRRNFESIYSGFVSDLDSPNTMVANLGSVISSERSPDEKIKANFLTTILTTSSRGANPQSYPRRPAPLLLVGVEIYGHRWGLSIHPDWKSNILRYLDDRRSNTPWTDLMLFLFRAIPIACPDPNISNTLKTIASSCFSNDIRDFVHQRLDVEKRFFKGNIEIFGHSFARVSEIDPDFDNHSIESNEELKNLRTENANLRLEIDRLRSRLSELELIAEEKIPKTS